jgi:hypothetical protein
LYAYVMNMSTTRKQAYTFTLLLHGADPLTEDNMRALENAGCTDALFGRRGTVSYADFDREAESFGEALLSAVQDVEGAIPGLKVTRVEPEELVSASQIAVRTKRTRESIRLLIDGKRGPGNFPAPAVWVSSSRKLWRWTDVADWFTTCLQNPVSDVEMAAFVASVNAALAVRRNSAFLPSGPSKRQLAKLLAEDIDLLKVG